jgi:hypothetical protein
MPFPALRAAILFLLLPVPFVALAQEKPAPEVVEEDLGDGFRAVSVNGGPPAIVDDETGLIFKQIYGRPAIVDEAAGAVLILSDEGEPVVKPLGKGRRDDAPALDKKTLARMKAYMQRVQDHGEAMNRLRQGGAAKGKGKSKGKGKKAKPAYDPAAAWAARVDAYLRPLQLRDEEALVVLRPLVGAILLQQDLIARSTVDAQKGKGGMGGKGGKGSKGGKAGQPGKNSGSGAAPWRPLPLPAEVLDYQRLFRAARRADADRQPLVAALGSYRAARRAQDAELKARRDELREVLTEDQEALLVAVGLLD